jgi:hypothetical protein
MKKAESSVSRNLITKIIALLAGMLIATMSLLLITGPLRTTEQILDQKIPVHTTEPAVESLKTLETEWYTRRMLRLQQVLDNLRKTKSGQRQYDSILLANPGLLNVITLDSDSIALHDFKNH